jgi:hypothetical protein
MYPYPGSPLYSQLFGVPDDESWERAHNYYTSRFNKDDWSDIQDAAPKPLEVLECTS